MKKEEFKAVWSGNGSFKSGLFKYDDGHLFIKKRRKFLFWLKEWVLIVGNVKDKIHDYELKHVLSMGTGRTDETVRMYPYDLDNLNAHWSNFNDDIKRRLTQLRIERNYYKKLFADMKKIVYSGGTTDMIKKRMHEEHKFYTGLRPSYVGANVNNEKDKKK